MITRKRTPQRIEQYFKYNSSNIFEEETEQQSNLNNTSSKENDSNIITPKPKENRLPQKQFEPKYEKLTSFQRYIKDFWNEQTNKIKTSYTINVIQSSRNYHKNFFIDKSQKTKEESDKQYTSRQRYVSQLFGDEYLIDDNNNSSKRNKKHFRSKSLFQKSVYLLENKDEEGFDDYKDIETENSTIIRKIIRNLNYYSDIFHIKKENDNEHILRQSFPRFLSSRKEEEKYNSIPMDELLFPDKLKKIVIKPLNLKDIKTKTIVPVYNTERQDLMKHMLPTGFDWVSSNTELSSKSHIYRSKNNNTNYIHRKAPSLNYALSNREVTQDYHFKFPNKKKEQNKNDDNHFYEMKGPKKFLDNLEDNTIKKLFLEKGIHIYNYQNKSVFKDDEDKITFQIRTNENEREFQLKLLRIKN